MKAKIKRASAPTLTGVADCHHRRKVKHTICAVCHHSFDFCPECEDGTPESCAKCKTSLAPSQWFSLMHNVTEVAA